ncbi:unnamed protein product [Anisakis simplex]|uniref:Major sperm protein n=1 Tax=Anisakis simplex TaxID=6269 RepID=A0A0M3JTH0_ANISI|nr:unnamed protein product [Anisakis simplex]
MADSSPHQTDDFVRGEFSEEERDTQSVHLINVDQRFICFDVDQLNDAKEELMIRRSVSVNKKVAWRFRTNAPTRYIVYPSCGILHDNENIKVTIELVNNRYHPYHKLSIQAILLPDGCDERSVWKHKSAKNVQNVQTIRLRLSTMLMNIEYSEYIGKEKETESANDLLCSVMAQSSTVGSDRVKELKNLVDMLEADIHEIRANTEQTIKLKSFLKRALQSRYPLYFHSSIPVGSR